MFSLYLTCRPEETDRLCGELWEEETAGLQEIPNGSDTTVEVIASFATSAHREALLARFEAFSPRWCEAPEIDWQERARAAWPGRLVGRRFFVAPPWCEERTPPERERIVQNPGLASGTGEHPCTQIALEALERCVFPACRLADIGTGSGILAIAALKLGAAHAFGFDLDIASLEAALGNFALNGLEAELVAASTGCIASETLDVTVANVNATVLLDIADDLLRITRPQGTLVLTGFAGAEADVVAQVFPPVELLERSGWSCIIARSC